jgi:hypothetical membrane protein
MIDPLSLLFFIICFIIMPVFSVQRYYYSHNKLLTVILFIAPLNIFISNFFVSVFEVFIINLSYLMMIFLIKNDSKEFEIKSDKNKELFLKSRKLLKQLRRLHEIE